VVYYAELQAGSSGEPAVEVGGEVIITMNTLPLKVDVEDRWSSSRYSAWDVPYPMRDTTLIDTPFYDNLALRTWVVAAREGDWTNIVLMSSDPEVAESVAVAMVLDLARQPDSSVPLLSTSIRCASAFDVHEDRDDLREYAIPIVAVLEIPAPSKTWVWDSFLKVAEKRRRGHGATVFWARASVFKEMRDEEKHLFRNIVDLDAA
jgi:hypothetical protein